MPDNPIGKVIPDKAGVQPGSAAFNQSSGSGALSDIVLLVSVVFLASSLALAAGVFVYSSYLGNKLSKMQESLNSIQDEFNRKTIEDLKLLDAQLKAADVVLRKHKALSELFRALELLTLRSVQINSLKYGSNSEDDLQIEIEGKALTVNSLALQSKIFGANRHVFQNPIFSDLDIKEDGVTFRVKSNVNPDFINFGNVVLKRLTENENGSGPSSEEANDSAPELDEFGVPVN